MDDCISRQAVLDIFDVIKEEYPQIYTAIEVSIRMLPSVTPTERTGHWIDAIEPIPLEERDAKLGITYKDAGYKCSECGAKHEEHRLSMIATKTNYCPNCGCRMVEPQESEDKE